MTNLEKFDNMGDLNEHFYGNDLDENKEKRLRTIIATAGRLMDYDGGIKMEDVKFGHRNRNAMVAVEFTTPTFFNDKRVLDGIEKLVNTADHMFMATENGKIIITFCVADMWKTAGYKLDEEQQKQMNDSTKK